LADPPVATPPPPAKPAPRLPDLSGEPAPYLSNEELNQLRRAGSDHNDIFVRLLNVFQRAKA
jgi:hypothetical protein